MIIEILNPRPEGSATQEQDNVNSSKIYSQSLAVSNTTVNNENYQGERNPDYRRPAEGWRVKVPDDEDNSEWSVCPC